MWLMVIQGTASKFTVLKKLGDKCIDLALHEGSTWLNPLYQDPESMFVFSSNRKKLYDLKEMEQLIQVKLKKH